MYIVYIKVKHKHAYRAIFAHIHVYVQTHMIFCRKKQWQMLSGSYLLNMERNQALWKVPFLTRAVILPWLQTGSSLCSHSSPGSNAVELPAILPVAIGSICSCSTLQYCISGCLILQAEQCLASFLHVIILAYLLCKINCSYLIMVPNLAFKFTPDRCNGIKRGRSPLFCYWY